MGISSPGSVCVCVNMFIMCHLSYCELTQIENIFQAWNEFKKGKSKRRDVEIFARNLEDNLFSLHESLKNKTYRHGNYESFFVQDPKQRHIHKASIQDRIVHHLLYKFLYKLFDSSFIYDSYSCRLGKGTHKGVKTLKKLARKVSKNNKKICWSLKCDVKKYFHTIDHEVLKRLLRSRLAMTNSAEVMWLLEEVIDSFHSHFGEKKGIPLGNLTSQVFANIYLNEFDQFVKHKLKIKYYLRYADDFLILDSNKDNLLRYIDILKHFLKSELKLDLHPKKITIRKYSQGIDFLGYVVFPYYSLPRSKTKRRLIKKLKEKVNSNSFEKSLQSYLGYLSHANSFKFREYLKNQIGFWKF